MEGLENKSRAPLRKRQRQLTEETEKLILQVRKENPIWGKKKIKVILGREYGINISTSTTGRVLTKLVKIGKIMPASFYNGRLNIKKSRVFDNHAQRWQQGMKAKKPGELIQVDHAVVEVAPGYFVKQFDATCPITKITVSEIYLRATSTTAAYFLSYMSYKFPFEIKSIQVDGGSEFMGDFELECKRKKIP